MHTPPKGCPRCAGLLCVEDIPWEHQQLYCISCGHRTDALIEANRAAHPQPKSWEDRTYPVSFKLAKAC